MCTAYVYTDILYYLRVDRQTERKRDTHTHTKIVQNEKKSEKGVASGE